MQPSGGDTFENIQTMMDTVREIGYPVDEEKLENMKVK